MLLSILSPGEITTLLKKSEHHNGNFKVARPNARGAYGACISFWAKSSVLTLGVAEVGEVEAHCLVAHDLGGFVVDLVALHQVVPLRHPPLPIVCFQVQCSLFRPYNHINKLES